MTAEPPNVGQIARVDGALETWRQGDCVVGEHWFALRIDVGAPLSDDARLAAPQGEDLIESQVRGLVVITQTCDLVRSCVERPFVEVCPLVEVEAQLLSDIERARRPRYALVPGTRDLRLVADLDRVMTIEKSLVARWTRTPGYESDEQGRAFALALARKRSRFAFPDDFNSFAAKLHQRMLDKHDKNSAEGRALRALRQIRVQASPGWQGDEVRLSFWFIRHDPETDFERKSWSELAKGWLELVSASGRFTEVEGQVVTLAEMSAAEYVGSDPLDLDHLSARQNLAPDQANPSHER